VALGQKSKQAHCNNFGRRVRRGEGVGKREFPVEEILKPRGFKKSAGWRTTGSTSEASILAHKFLKYIN